MSVERGLKCEELDAMIADLDLLIAPPTNIRAPSPRT